MFNLVKYKELDSTNAKAVELISEKKDKVAIVAELQKKGKGRRKRSWSSEKGGIYISLLLKLRRLEKLQYFTLITALSVRNSIKKTLKLSTDIKWPNDILYKNKKIAGILAETRLGRENYIIIGIGINTNNKIPLLLRRKAASLSNISGKKIDNQLLIHSLLCEFESYYKKYQKKNYSALLKEYTRCCITLNKKVKIETNGRILEGFASSIDENGCLILKQSNKTIKIIDGTVLI